MDYTATINELERNKDVFKNLLQHLSETAYRWKTVPERWCLLEIICHLVDEEREDFRARVHHTLETPAETMQPIDPQGWVTARKYMEQDFSSKLEQFLTERETSVKWLRSLHTPNWDNAYQHPKFGAMTAKMFLANWLAHDYLHIRQILSVRFEYLKQRSEEDLGYAGNW